MAKTCVLCNKTAGPGNKYVRRGMVKSKGGAGSKVTGKSFRRFEPNLQRIKISIAGSLSRAYVCTKCIKAGKAVKAL